MQNTMCSAMAFAPATQALHADDLCSLVTDVAPPLHVSTTFRYAKKVENGDCEVCSIDVC
jgi:hypothetical protein